jgi:hypothetical protein
VGEAVTTAAAYDMAIAFDAAGCSALAYGIRDGSWQAKIPPHVRTVRQLDVIKVVAVTAQAQPFPAGGDGPRPAPKRYVA